VKMLLSGAAWRDEQSGVVERAEFIGSAGDRLLTTAHLPTGPASGAVVICSPTGRAHLRGYRREVILGRALARRGIAAARFCYRGVGNSDVLPSGEPTLETMDQDTSVVTQWLAGVTGAAQVGFCGSGLECLVAARAAAARPDAPLVLIEPASDGRSYYRQLFRSGQVAGARSGEGGTTGSRALLDEQGWVDVLGYRVERAGYEIAAGRSLTTELHGGDRPVLVVQIDRRDGLRPDLAKLADGWREAGVAVETLVIKVAHAWWFIPDWEPDESEQENVELVLRVVDWLSAHLEPRG